jgi:hypothetical protein
VSRYSAYGPTRHGKFIGQTTEGRLTTAPSGCCVRREPVPAHRRVEQLVGPSQREVCRKPGSVMCAGEGTTTGIAPCSSSGGERAPPNPTQVTCPRPTGSATHGPHVVRRHDLRRQAASNRRRTRRLAFALGERGGRSRDGHNERGHHGGGDAAALRTAAGPHGGPTEGGGGHGPPSAGPISGGRSTGKLH